MFPISCDYCGKLGGSIDEETAKQLTIDHLAICPGLKEEDIIRAQQYLICQDRGHKASNMMTSSNPPQNICEFCGTYYWSTTVTTLHEGFRKPPPAAIEAALSRR